jgi:DNA excision repair protein ERCC-6
MEQVATCSGNMDTEEEELTELSLEQGISVWGKNQETLEQQALVELNIFAQQNDTNELEDGEVVEDKKPNIYASLDINSYLKRQEELRKIQEYKKTLQVSSKSKVIADKISEKCSKNFKRKKVCNTKLTVDKKIKLEASTEKNSHSSGSEYVPSENELGICNNLSVYLVNYLLLSKSLDSESEQIANGSNQFKRKRCSVEFKNTQKFKDDGSLVYFQSRLEEYYKLLENENSLEDEDPDSLDYYTIKGGLKVPFKIWNNLYEYQQEGVRWLWNIHRQATGGLLGDEMGLGKTVQVIAFLAGLEYSQVISYDRFKGLGPTLIVCPVTVIYQWVKHFHDWAPEFRVAILHQSGSYQGKKSSLIKEINKSKGILITSYVGILKYKDYLAQYDWHYLILDEGHKIRNPNAKVSIAVKKIKTPHRLMLTGSPMQNNLQELWSLFDFTNPGMLGNLNTFMEHFNNPIVQGGFVNATPMQEATALSVATTLKNLITPFLLRRSKDEVQNHISLPNKSEQVLFCSLTEEQRELYKGYLMSDHVGYILGKDSKKWFLENSVRSNVLIAITALRKICNHPDIYLHTAEEVDKVNEKTLIC